MHNQSIIQKVKDQLAKTPMLKGVLLFLLLGFAYFIFIKLTGLMIPCSFKLVTGFNCPGCGVTHMVLHIFDGEFELAFWDNPFLFVFGPVIIAYLIYYFYKQSKGEQIKYGKYIEIGFLVLVVIFWILRNIYGI